MSRTLVHEACDAPCENITVPDDDSTDDRRDWQPEVGRGGTATVTHQCTDCGERGTVTVSLGGGPTVLPEGFRWADT